MVVPDLLQIDLKLSTDLINRNFSNYSAWHLRALLQQAPPKDEALQGAGQAAFVDPVDLTKELDWVQQGIYTEPNDQSVWLYHHWLTTLGRGSEPARITHCALLDGQLFVFFSAPVVACPEGEATVTVSGAGGAGALKAAGSLAPLGPDAAGDAGGAYGRTRQLPGSRRRWAHAWRFAQAEPQRFPAAGAVEVRAVVEELGSHPDGRPVVGKRVVSFTGPAIACDDGEGGGGGAAGSPALAAVLASPPEPARLQVLQGELARVEELLEIEPDCRWALLARGRLGASAAAGSGREAVEAAESLVADGYDRIAALDPLRKGFYVEARAASLLRLRSLAWLAAGSLSAPLDLTGLSLRHLPPATVLALFGLRRLDVSGVGLQALGPVLQLRSLEELLAARNGLRGDLREAFCLPRLQRLDVSGNALELRPAAAPPAPPEPLREVLASDNPALLALLRAAGGAQDFLSRFAPAGHAGWALAGDAAAGQCTLRRA